MYKIKRYKIGGDVAKIRINTNGIISKNLDNCITILKTHFLKGVNMSDVAVGIIGGSGLYEVDGLNVIDEVFPDTPWGKPSDSITIGELGGTRVAFLARHGRGHSILPSEVPSRANIAAFKSLGLKTILSFSAMGSLQQEHEPQNFIVPDQVIDRTRSRANSFFGEGIVGHVGFADPFCEHTRVKLISTLKALGITFGEKGTVICMEGPLFSTRAESNLYRAWGGDVINMSVLPEAKLAREAEMCYALVGMVTDYDCWKSDHDDVTLEMIIENLTCNAATAKKVIHAVVSSLGDDCPCGCQSAAATAIVTAKEKRPEKTVQKLKTLYPDYL